MRTVIFLVAFCLLAVSVSAFHHHHHQGFDQVTAWGTPRPVHRMRQQKPVPLHYRKPLIDTSATSSPDKTESLARIAKIIAKEPLAAKLRTIHTSEDALDLYNGEEITPEDRAARQSRIISKEVNSLKALIKQGKAILKVLPKKQKRLRALEARLKVINGKKARAAAADKLETQKQLLKDIAKQEAAMAKRLATLRNTHSKLANSVKKVKKIAKKGKKASKKVKKLGKKAKKASKKAKKLSKKAKKAKKAHKKAKKAVKKSKKDKKKLKKFMFRSARSDVDLDAELEAEVENQQQDFADIE